MSIMMLKLFFNYLSTHTWHFLLPVGLVLIVAEAEAQEKIGLEFSSGISNSVISYSTSNPYYSTFSNPSYMGSIGMLYKISDDFRLVAQGEFVRRSFYQRNTIITSTSHITETGSFNTLGENEPQLVFGLRKYLNGNRNGLYLQPGVSLIFVPDVHNSPEITTLPNGDKTGLMANRDLGVALRADAGYSFVNKRENYFLLGLRFQQGLTVNQHLNFTLPNDGFPDVFLSNKTRGSYFSFYSTYGINGANWNNGRRITPRKFYNENKTIKHQLSNEDGLYLVAYGGFRIKQPFTPAEDIYFNSSGQFSAVMGYKLGRYSIESGYGQFSAGNSISINYGSQRPFWTDWVVYGTNTPHIPVTFKYDIPVSNLKTVRFGPSFTTHILLKDNTDVKPFIYRGNGGVLSEDGKIIEVNGVINSLPIEERKRMFFNAGMHLEFQVFNSSFMSLNITRNFGAPVISRFEADYMIDNTPIQFEQEATLNGFRFDFGYKLPLNILSKQKKLALKR